MECFSWTGATEPEYYLDHRARNRLRETILPDAAGAWAAMECHYHAFNQRDLTVMRELWSPDAAAQLDRPNGGTARGADEICAEYAEIFARPQRATLRLTDVTAFLAIGQAVFVGIEIVSYAGATGSRVARFRATRCVWREPETGRWRQFHYHGSPAATRVDTGR